MNSNITRSWLLPLTILLLTIIPRNSLARLSNESELNSSVYLSPKFVMDPGSVSNKYYYNINFPRGHIALKSFNAEVVDENGNSVPLHETYLHHWAIIRYYHRLGVDESYSNGDFDLSFHKSDFIIVKNSGVCGFGLPQIFGLGSETRRTETHIPDPYGIEVENPSEIPSGYEERWLLNVHAIDTRGSEDSLGCIECRCDLYNVTRDEYGQALTPDYLGGLRCCYDETRCKVRKGFESSKRILFVRYTVKWVNWDTNVLPVKIYILDVTDKWKKSDAASGSNTKHDCQIEYNIEPCDNYTDSNVCIDSKRVSLSFPAGGDVIYGAAHQHSGGIGSALYREDGTVICASMPIYGDGKEAGNEEGYIVGMSTCYPKPGSVKIFNGETTVLESNYSNSQSHTGVMGLFYLLIAEPSTKPSSVFQAQGKPKKPDFVWGEVVFGVSITAGIIAAYRKKRQREDRYETIVV